MKTNKDIFVDNLNFYLNEKEMTPTDLARQLGYPETTVYNWTQKVAYPRLDKIQEIADFFGIYKSNLTEEKTTAERFSSLSKAIPLIGRIAAGTPVLAEQNIEDYFSIDKSIKCSCGAHMNGQTTVSRGVRYYYYRCSERCGTKRIRADVLDTWFESAMTGVLTETNVMETIVEKALSRIDTLDTHKKVDDIKRQIAGVETQIGNVVNLLSHSGSISLLEKLEALEVQKKTLEGELMVAHQGSDMTKEKLMEKFKQFANFKNMNVKQKRELLPMLVDKIKIHSDNSITVDLLNLPKSSVDGKFDILMVQKDRIPLYPHIIETIYGCHVRMSA